MLLLPLQLLLLLLIIIIIMSFLLQQQLLLLFLFSFLLGLRCLVAHRFSHDVILCYITVGTVRRRHCVRLSHVYRPVQFKLTLDNGCSNLISVFQTQYSTL